MIELVISGGQTGADQAGLRAAKAFGIPTGGYAPRGWLVETGTAPWLSGEFGLVECPEPSWGRPDNMPNWQWNAICYVERTKMNAQNSGLILWFEMKRNNDSRGFKPTEKYSRSLLVVTKDDRTRTTSTPKGLIENFGGMLSRTVNIAGSRESKSPGIGAWVESYLSELFRILKEI